MSSESASLEESKRQLRRRMVVRRRELSQESFERAGRLAAERLAGLQEFGQARVVALYAALPDELPTHLVFDACVRSAAARLLPRCTAGGDLEFASVERWEDLRRGRYGVLEPPAERAAVPLRTADLVLVPGVAFDPAGGRLGRGHGYYDRALASEEPGGPLRVGFALAFQIVERVPVGPLDRPMDVVVTEEAILRTAE